jgi:hypothetical protein|tara:strand:+ start:1058 stop:2227 length:1170 start_codon:yes stop_codon:yes gene_type:complete
MKYLILLLLIIECYGFINFNSIMRSSCRIVKEYYKDDMYYKRVENNKNRNISIVLWNGYDVKPIYYNKFINNIINNGYKKNLSIECYVVRNNKIPNNLSNYYLLGHSSGGYQVLKKGYNKNIKASIVYGSTNNINKKLYYGFGKIEKDERKKTLVILADKDRYINVLNLNDEIEKKSSSYKYLIAPNNYHDSISNGKTNCIGNIFNENKLYNNTHLSNQISKMIIEYLLDIEKLDNNLDKLIKNSNYYLNNLTYINEIDRNEFPLYILNNIYDVFNYDIIRNYLEFIISKPFINKLKIYVDYNILWIKSFNDKIEKKNLEKAYNKFFNKMGVIDKKYKIEIKDNCNTLSWIINKPYIKNNKIVIQHYNFLFYNYYKIPTLLYLCMNMNI